MALVLVLLGWSCGLVIALVAGMAFDLGLAATVGLWWASGVASTLGLAVVSARFHPLRPPFDECDVHPNVSSR